MTDPLPKIAPTIALIVAVAANGVIGRAGCMPWRLPSDLKRFRSLTMGKPVLMGRRTYDSIGRPLEGRINIVISRDAAFSPAGVIVEREIERGLETALMAAQTTGADEVMVIGGGAIYAALMERAHRLYITHVEDAPEGDTCFPAIDPARWRPIREERPPPNGQDTTTLRFVDYERYGSKCP